MNASNLRGNIPWLLTLIALIVGCSTSAPTRLCDGFQSYQTVQGVRAMLSKLGIHQEWRETFQGSGPGDRRPPYRLTSLSGPYELSGVRGELRLTFFNGRLMAARFSTRKGNDYIAALRAENSKVPPKPSTEIITDVRTKFRFDVSAEGNTVFTWYDPKLDAEWTEWVRSNA